MTTNQYEKIQSEIEKRANQKIRRKKLKMKMSGKQIKNLQRIIIEKKNQLLDK